MVEAVITLAEGHHGRDNAVPGRHVGAVDRPADGMGQRVHAERRLQHHGAAKKASDEESTPRIPPERRNGHRDDEPDADRHRPVEAVLQSHAAQLIEIGQAGDIGRCLPKVEQPAHVHPPPAPGHRVGVSRAVRVGVMGAVVCAPREGGALERRRAEHQEEPADRSAGPIGAMGEEPVVARRDRKATQRVQRHGQHDGPKRRVAHQVDDPRQGAQMDEAQPDDVRPVDAIGYRRDRSIGTPGGLGVADGSAHRVGADLTRGRARPSRLTTARHDAASPIDASLSLDGRKRGGGLAQRQPWVFVRLQATASGPRDRA